MKYLLLPITLVLLFSACEKDLSPLLGLKDPREFSYTLDTLSLPTDQISMHRIDGASSNNLWAVGQSSSTPGTIFRYNRKQWKPVDLMHLFPVGTMYDILVLSENNVWVVGTVLNKTQSLHFNGVEWREVGTRRPGQFSSIWGSSPTDIWACGFDKVYYWKNGNWIEVDVPKRSSNIHFIQIRGVAPDNIFMTCLKRDATPPVDSTFYYFYRFNGLHWTISDSALISLDHPEPGFGFILEEFDGKLYSAGEGVYIFKDRWKRLLYNPSISRVNGANEKYIFASGASGIIMFFNGIDWYPLEPIADFRHYIAGIWTDGREVFFLADDGWRSYVIHGK